MGHAGTEDVKTGCILFGSGESHCVCTHAHVIYRILYYSASHECQLLNCEMFVPITTFKASLADNINTYIY